MIRDISIPTSPSAEDVKQAVTQPRNWRLILVVSTLALAIAGGVAFYVVSSQQTEAVNYITRSVETGDITSTATATGNLEPRATVTVGAEISGTIKSVAVKDSQRVEEGQLLATFDLSDLNSELELAKASLSSSNASVRRAVATYNEALAEEARTKRLVDRGVTARADLETAQAATTRAKADLDKARADSQRAKATVEETGANLNKAEIRSPIAGVIMERNVEPGQTVASSLQAPELFVVAEDLSKMHLEIWIDEADVGVVKPGQEATFEVAAYSGRSFDAVVESIDISPTTTDNVVTYLALLTVDNTEGLLRPGMTATATIVTQKNAGVMRVPNAALRFNPDAGEAKTEENSFSLVPQRPRRRSSAKTNSDQPRTSRGKVYVLRNGQLEVVRVRTGATDGLNTEVISDDLKDGDKVVVGVGSEENSQSSDSKGRRGRRGQS